MSLSASAQAHRSHFCPSHKMLCVLRRSEYEKDSCRREREEQTEKKDKEIGVDDVDGGTLSKYFFNGQSTEPLE